MLKCTNCNSNLKILHGGYTNYLKCSNCSSVFKQKDFLKSKVNSYEKLGFLITEYKNSSNTTNTILLFAGLNTTSAKFMQTSRILLFAEMYNYNVITVADEKLYFEDTTLSRLENLIRFLCNKNSLISTDIVIAGFSNGGIALLRTAELFKFRKCLFISGVLSRVNFSSIKDKGNKITIYNNLKDVHFLQQNKILSYNMQEFCEVINIDAGHNPYKSLQNFFCSND